MRQLWQWAKSERGLPVVLGTMSFGAAGFLLLAADLNLRTNHRWWESLLAGVEIGLAYMNARQGLWWVRKVVPWLQFSVFWSVLYQRCYQPTFQTIMYRDMLERGFGIHNNKLVVIMTPVISRRFSGAIRRDALGAYAWPLDAILITPAAGAFGPAGVLFIGLHETTHAAGFLRHDEQFQQAYLTAGRKFGWFDEKTARYFNQAVINGDLRPFHERIH